MEEISVPLHIVSLMIGTCITCMCVIAITAIIIEPLRRKRGDTISFDFILLQFVGFVCLCCQDNYGFFCKASSYSTEVHIPDIFLSFYGVTAFAVLNVSIRMLPKSTICRISFIRG